jgi:hypothetical protein
MKAFSRFLRLSATVGTLLAPAGGARAQLLITGNEPVRALHVADRDRHLFGRGIEPVDPERQFLGCDVPG